LTSARNYRGINRGSIEYDDLLDELLARLPEELESRARLGGVVALVVRELPNMGSCRVVLRLKGDIARDLGVTRRPFWEITDAARDLGLCWVEQPDTHNTVFRRDYTKNVTEKLDPSTRYRSWYQRAL
jgi:hypothetical protein